MKPDWQNKSYAKTSSPTAPSTMHSKLKVGMTSLHSKIAVSNHNMPSQPMPAVRKFADGGSVRTRSDDEIGDTDLRTGKVDPGSYDRRMAQGEKNLQALKDAFNKFTGDNKPSASAESTMSPDSMASTYYGGKKDSDTAKPVEMKTETTTEPSYMKDVRDTLSKPKAESTMTMTEEPTAVKTDKPSAAKTAKPSVAKSSSRPMPAAPSQTKETAAQMREKQVRTSGGSRGARMREAATDTGDEMTRLRDKTSKSIPGVVGRFDLQGNQIPVGLGPRSSQVYSGDGSTAMSRAENRYLQSRIDAGNLTAMERAQAKRAGLI
jgi:hypothetical protein